MKYEILSEHICALICVYLLFISIFTVHVNVSYTLFCIWKDPILLAVSVIIIQTNRVWIFKLQLWRKAQVKIGTISWEMCSHLQKYISLGTQQWGFTFIPSHFILLICSHVLLLNWNLKAVLYTDFCLFICYPPNIKDSTHPGAKMLYYHTNRFLVLSFICLEGQSNQIGST